MFYATNIFLILTKIVGIIKNYYITTLIMKLTNKGRYAVMAMADWRLMQGMVL